MTGFGLRTAEGVIADLVHSADDGGWYWQRWDDDRTSIIYRTKGEALAASPVRWDV